MLSNRYPLETSQISDFEKNGHVFLKNVLPLEVLVPYRDEIRSWAIDFKKNQKPMEERDTYGRAFLQMMNLWEENELIKQFSLAKRFGQVASDLLGVKNVRLYHDQALFKEPGGGLTPWHQDQYYWPMDTDKTVTMWMPLVDIEDGMGMLTFASGSQYVSLPPLGISDESEKIISEFVIKHKFPIVAQKTMKAGDATFHRGWTLHAAPGNETNTMREVMTLIFMDADMRVTEPKNPNQEADRQRWFQGLASGSLAASSINPII